MRNGFIFTIDAMLSLMFTALFMSHMYFYLPLPEDLYKHSNLYEYSSDLLTVLDKSGYLDELAGADVRNTQELLSNTPEQYCFYVRVRDSSDSKVATIKKHKCKGKKDADVFVRRVFIHDGGVYVAELDAWYKVKKEG